MECSWCCLFLAAVAVALSTPRPCSANYRVYITATELQSYYQDTEHADAVRGHYVDIVRGNEDFVLMDGSLQLTYGAGESATEGSGLSSATGMPLPPLPSFVDEISISWHASEEVSYELHVGQDPEGVFEGPRLNISENGTIPRSKTAFSISFPCLSSSSDMGQLEVDLTATPSSANHSAMHVSFHLEKNCSELTGESSALPTSTPFLSSTTQPLSASPTPTSTRAQSTPLSFPPTTTPPSQPLPSDSPILSRVPPSLEPTPSLLATPLLTPEVSTTIVVESTPAPSTSEGITPMESSEVGSGDMSVFVPGTTVMTSLDCGTDSGRLQPFCVSATITDTAATSQSPLPLTATEISPTPTAIQAPSPSSAIASSSLALVTTSQPSSSLVVTFVFSTMELASTPVAVSSPVVRVSSSREVGFTPVPSALRTSSATFSSVAAVSSTAISPPVSQATTGPGEAFTPVPSVLRTSRIVPSTTAAISSPMAQVTSSPEIGFTPTPSPLLASSVVSSSPAAVSSVATSSSEVEVTPVLSALATSSVTVSSPAAVSSAATSSSEVEVTPAPSALTSSTTVSPSVAESSSPVAQATSSPELQFTPAPPSVEGSKPPSSPTMADVTSAVAGSATPDGSIVPTDSSVAPSAEGVRTTAVAPLPPSSPGEVAVTSLPVMALPSETPTVVGTEATTEPALLQMLLIVLAPVVGILLASIALLCCCICCCVCAKKRRGKKTFNDDPLDVIQTVAIADEEEGKKEIPVSLWMPLTWGTVHGLPQPIQAVIHHFTVDRRSLTLLSTMVRGQYGCIANGQLSIDRTDVMGGNRGILMKMLIGLKEGSPRDEVVRFLEQATAFRGIEHPNLQPVLRVSVEDNIVPLVIYPIVEYGNMHSFLHHCRIAPEESPINPMTNQWKVNFSLQIAVAMKFLSDNRVVHHDLALRNCLLDTNFTVKVSDGALAPEFYPECYQAVYGTVRPVRWAAIETLQEGLCTSQSNVWSFGVTVWEVMTLADLPYPEVDNNRSILTHLMMDSRLPSPEGCPENLYSLMSDCWRKRAEERPNFTVMLGRLEEMYSRYTAIQAMDDHFSSSPQAGSTDDLSFSTFGKNPAVLRSSVGSNLEAGGSGARRNRGSGAHRRSSGVSKASRHRDSRDEKLSLTFSVLSGDAAGSSAMSGSDSEGEGGPRLSSAALNLELLSPVLSEEPLLETSGSSSHLHTPTSLNHQSGYSATNPYLNLPSSFLTPHRDTSALLTPPAKFGAGSSSAARDTPPNHLGQPRERREDSSSTILPLTTSPSPDMTSKTSTCGDETMSTTSFSVSAVPTSASSQVNADAVSKTSTLDLESISTTVSIPASQASHSLPGHYSNCNGSTDEQKSRNRSPLLFDCHPRTNGSASISPQGRASKSTDSGIRSDDEVDGPPVMDAERTSAQPNSAAFTSPEVPRSEQNAGSHPSGPSRGSRTSQTSFGLGLSDLSSDFMSAFDTWNVGNT